MKPIVWGIAFLWGIGQNLPFDGLYVHGVGAGDFAFLITLAAMLTTRPARAALAAEVTRLQPLLILVLALIGLTAASAVFNAFAWDLEANDLVEMVRPAYYFAIVVCVSIWTRVFGLGLLVAFVGGILFSGIVAYLRPASTDVLGFVMLWNPNVIGNMLAVGILYSSLLLFENRHAHATVFLLGCMVLSVFTYSKGTWLMAALGFVAFLLAMSARPGSRGAQLGAWLLKGGIAGLLVLLALNFDAVYELVSFKLLTTQLGDTAAEGGTAAARWGFVEVSMQLAMNNPLFGIGISNFESVYRSLERPLGNAYWVTDNPHSAWLYLLACMGVPALLVFFAIFAGTLRELHRRVPLQGAVRLTYVGIFVVVLFLSGAVMLQLLTQYFFWFFIGIVYGWSPASFRRVAEAG